MQITLNQLAEALAERVGKQFDSAFKQELKVFIDYWRTKLIIDSLNSRPIDRKFFTQWIDMPLEQVNLSDFTDFPEYPVLRTICKVPKPVRANSKLFDFVGKLNKMDSIPVHEPMVIKALLHSKWTGSEPRAAYINEKLYVFGNLLIPGISIQMIPESIENFKACCVDCGSVCINDDDPYPVSKDIAQRIMQSILATELRAMPQVVSSEIPLI